MWEDFLAVAVPTILPIVGTALAWVIGHAARVASERWGVEIEARHRDALHSAILSGIEAAIRRNVPAADVPAAALGYVKRSVPDAVRKLRAGDDVLVDLIEASRGRGASS